MTDIEPGQMDIFDILEPAAEPAPRLQNKEPEPEPAATPRRKTDREKAEGLLIRLNEHHLDKNLVDKKFLEWVAASGIQVGDFFTIKEVNAWKKQNKGVGEK